MNTWVLLIMIYAHSGDYAVIESIHFSDQQSCVAAKSEFHKMHESNQYNKYQSVRSRCIKGAVK